MLLGVYQVREAKPTPADLHKGHQQGPSSESKLWPLSGISCRGSCATYREAEGAVPRWSHCTWKLRGREGGYNKGQMQEADPTDRKVGRAFQR